jgi:transposase, IS5 family
VRRIKGDAALEEVFGLSLMLARRVREQRQNRGGPKVYSLHAPEVEGIGKGKAHRPYEFGVKVSIATTLHHSKGGQFIAHVKALPGDPYDGHIWRPSSPKWKRRSAPVCRPSSPIAAIAATTRRPTTR